jgi:hypothetical protein
MLFGRRLLTLGVFATLLLSPKLVSQSSADGGSNHQTRNLHFGVSGGNVNDISKAFCCSGTLGALVKDNNNVLYVLSNNHVLGRSGYAVAGEDVSQPGLIDSSCRVSTVVADFAVAAPLGPSNVDAAIAQLIPGQMDSSGYIEDIGTISSVVTTPAVGLSVAKSGRTTGFTTGTIGAVNATISVQYQKGCNQGKKFVITFTNQVVINGSNFSAGGDSGSVIVTNDSNHQPVALLYAGSSTTTIGNPAGEVLSELGEALGGNRTLSFVGSKAGGSSADPASSITPFAVNSPRQDDVRRAVDVKRRNERSLMARQGVIGVGVGASESDSEPVIVLYVDRSVGHTPSLPDQVDDVRVRVILTDPIIAY